MHLASYGGATYVLHTAVVHRATPQSRGVPPLMKPKLKRWIASAYLGVVMVGSGRTKAQVLPVFAISLLDSPGTVLPFISVGPQAPGQ